MRDCVGQLALGGDVDCTTKKISATAVAQKKYYWGEGKEKKKEKASNTLLTAGHSNIQEQLRALRDEGGGVDGWAVLDVLRARGDGRLAAPEGAGVGVQGALEGSHAVRPADVEGEWFLFVLALGGCGAEKGSEREDSAELHF